MYIILSKWNAFRADPLRNLDYLLTLQGRYICAQPVTDITCSWLGWNISRPVRRWRWHCTQRRYVTRERWARSTRICHIIWQCRINTTRGLRNSNCSSHTVDRGVSKDRNTYQSFNIFQRHDGQNMFPKKREIFFIHFAMRRFDRSLVLVISLPRVRVLSQASSRAHYPNFKLETGQKHPRKWNRRGK
jgi:hypothetical protein